MKNLRIILGIFIFLAIVFEAMVVETPYYFTQPFGTGSWRRSSYIFAGEYRPWGYDSVHHQAYYYPNSSGQPQAFTGQPAYSQNGWGGPHDFGWIDTLGNAWVSGSNEAGQDAIGSTTGTCFGCAVEVTADSAGNALPPFVQIHLTGVNPSPYWFNAYLTTYATGGRVGVSGTLQGGVRGNGTAGATTQTTIVWVPILNGDTIIKLTGLYALFGLTSQGKVQSWGNFNDSFTLCQGSSPANNRPGYVSGIPSGWFAYDVTSNAVGTWVMCDSGNHVYHKILAGGWQYDPAYQGRGSNDTHGHSYLQDVTNNSFLHKMTQNGARWVTKCFSNSETYYFICNDGSLWDIGGNAVGTIGNGKSMNLASTNWFYNQGQNSFNQDTVYNVAPGTTNWVNVYCSPSNCWYVYATTSDGKMYNWGNNKGGESWNGILDPNFNSGQIHAAYPNSWCTLWPTLIGWPGTSIVVKITTSPYCQLNPGGSPCNTFTIPSAASPSVTASNQSTTGTTYTMTGVTVAAASPYFINSTTITQVSGPNTAIIQFPSSPTTNILGLITGSYVFNISTTDNNLRTTSANMTLTVGSTATISKLKLSIRVNSIH